MQTRYLSNSGSSSLHEVFDGIHQAAAILVRFLLVHIGQKQIPRVINRSESLGQDIGLSHHVAASGVGAVNLGNNFIELDPSLLLRRLVSGKSHDKGDKTIRTGAGDSRIIDKRLAELNGLLDIGFVVTGEEEIIGHISIAGEVALVNLGSVGVDIVGLDHTLGSQNLGTLIVTIAALSANINHGLDTVGVLDHARGGVKFLRSIKLLNGLVNVTRTEGKDLKGIFTGEETRHVKIMDRHISKDSAATVVALSSSRSTSRRIEHARIDRKKDFMKRAGDNYGYQSSPAGHIDTWRERGFPHLIPPIANAADDAASVSPTSEPEVYLDYAGAALPSRSQLESIMSHYSTAGALANPHSTGPAASRTMVLIEQAKKLVLDHFNGHPGKSHGIGTAGKDRKSDDLGPDHHPGYEVIFTSGTTESLRIVAESFRWTCGKEGDDDASRTDCGRGGSVLLYSHNSHTSVVGMRGPAMAKGGTFRCVPLEKLTSATSKDFSEWANESSAPRDDGCRICSVDKSSEEDNETVNHLMVLPVECNFGGDRPHNIAKLIQKARQPFMKQSGQRSKSRWSVLFDIAKAASTGPVDLRNLDPDFACLSFYKMFGEPTGLGVLFVKRSSLRLLEEKHSGDESIGTNRYFGGGSVDVVLAGQNFVSPRLEPSAASSFVHGSVHFRGISTLVHGFEEVKQVGGMAKVSQSWEYYTELVFTFIYL